MTQDWHIAPLGEVTQFINGLWKGEDPPFVHVGVIRNTNFSKEGALDDSNIAYLDVEAKKFQKRRLQFGDLILEKSGGGPKQPVGRVVFFDKAEGDFSFSNFTAAIRVIDPTALDSRFLHKYLHWVYVSGRTEAMQSHSTGIRNLNGDAYKAILVAYPRLSEQHRIVAILDEAFEGIATAKANAEKNLLNVQALYKGQLEVLFRRRDDGCRELRLSDVAREFGRGKSRHRPRNEPALYGGRYPFIQTGDISGADHCLNEFTQTYSEMGLAQSRIWPAGTVCIAIVGATVGETAILSFDACFPDSVIGIVVDTYLADSEYVEYMLQSFKALLKEKGQGTARDNINLGTFENQLFPFPSLSRQQEIALMLNKLRDEVRQLEAIALRKIAALDELKKSLLHQAFTGQL